MLNNSPEATVKGGQFHGSDFNFNCIAKLQETRLISLAVSKIATVETLLIMALYFTVVLVKVG